MLNKMQSSQHRAVIEKQLNNINELAPEHRKEDVLDQWAN